MTRRSLILLCLLILVIGSAQPSIATSTNDSILNENDRVYDSVIVGGGIAGLTTAYYLKDYDVLLLEKEDVVGGRALSGEYKDFSYTKGTEYLGELEGSLKVMSDELGVEPIEIPSPMDVIYSNDRFYYGTAGNAKYLIDRSSIEMYNRFVETILDLDQKMKNGEDVNYLYDISAEDWMIENDFSDVYIESYDVVFRGLFGANISEVSWEMALVRSLLIIPKIA